MQNLISLIYLITGVSIFYTGYRVGANVKREPKQDGSFFMPPPAPVEKDVPAKQQEKEDKANRFYK